MNELFLELQNIDWGVFMGSIAVLIVAIPKIKKYLDDFESESGFQFPWTTKRKAIQKKFEELDNKINTTRKELDDKIESIHNAEHIEHEVWHQQSISIRDNLTENQHKMEESQHKLEENQISFMQTLADISAAIAELKEDFLDERLERKRWNILNCASKLRNGEFVDYEEYNNVFQDYDSYEDLIKKNGLTNGLIEESIKFIREKYQKYQDSLCKEREK